MKVQGNRYINNPEMIKNKVENILNPESRTLCTTADTHTILPLFFKTHRLEHHLTLPIKGIDICLYRFHAFFSCECQHIQDTSSADVPVLVFFANHNSNFSIVYYSFFQFVRSPQVRL